MKALAIKIVALALLLPGSLSIAMQQNKNNPQNDPDVQKGYDKHQAEHKKASSNSKSNQDDDKYNVKKSGDTVNGNDIRNLQKNTDNNKKKNDNSDKKSNSDKKDKKNKK